MRQRRRRTAFAWAWGRPMMYPGNSVLGLLALAALLQVASSIGIVNSSATLHAHRRIPRRVKGGSIHLRHRSSVLEKHPFARYRYDVSGSAFPRENATVPIEGSRERREAGASAHDLHAMVPSAYIHIRPAAVPPSKQRLQPQRPRKCLLRCVVVYERPVPCPYDRDPLPPPKYRYPPPDHRRPPIRWPGRKRGEWLLSVRDSMRRKLGLLWWGDESFNKRSLVIVGWELFL